MALVDRKPIEEIKEVGETFYFTPEQIEILRIEHEEKLQSEIMDDRDLIDEYEKGHFSHSDVIKTILRNRLDY